jgi:AcrR family transcriptional regulator
MKRERPPAQLRQRKKLLQRQAIADVAMRLFIERGFEDVSVAEIARAADVAENTVFNYFPTKEDLFFDQQAAAEDVLAGWVRSRSPGQSMVDAVRQSFVQALEDEDPRVGLTPGMPRFWEMVDRSSRLQARLSVIGERLLQRLADAFVDEAVGGQDPGLSRVMASMVAGVVWALQREIRQRLSEGESVAVVKESMRPLAARSFALLEHGLAAAEPPSDQRVDLRE